MKIRIDGLPVSPNRIGRAHWSVQARNKKEWTEKVGKLGDADLCQANAWGIKKSDYLAIGVEA